MKQLVKPGLALVTVLTVVLGASLAVAGTIPGVSWPGGSSGVSPSTNYQSDLAADGRITDDEMTDAVSATLRCLQGRGLTATVVAGDPRDRVARVIVVTTMSDTSPGAEVLACKQEFMAEVDLIYALQEGENSPLPVSEMGRVFDACLASEGYPAVAGANLDPYSADRLRAVQESGGGTAIQTCLRVVEEARRGE